MSLGAFLTDESMAPPIKAALSPGSKANVLQRWDHGQMRWRICQFVSAHTVPVAARFSANITLAAGRLLNTYMWCEYAKKV
jgi:hypothetical protein